MERKSNNILVTGGCGFIGSNFINYLFNESEFKGNILNVDKLTYAGNPLNLEQVSKKFKNRYRFEKLDICETEKIIKLLEINKIDTIVHFAAESHVDRSIEGPAEFIKSNIIGTFSLLEAVRKLEEKNQSIHFHHISTDEVYGSLGESGFFKETTAYNPRSPYSASKASSDHLVRAYFHTYNLSITLSNCSNNYGPLQFPEKLIPVVVLNAKNNVEIPVYGNGKNIRDWLFVKDHCIAIYKILKKGKTGESYNIGGGCQIDNLSLVEKICDIVDMKLNRKKGSSQKLIKFVKDRKGHDYRYAIDNSKIINELGVKPETSFEKGLEETVVWYLENKEWIDLIKSKEYLNWIQLNYKNRG